MMTKIPSFGLIFIVCGEVLAAKSTKVFLLGKIIELMTEEDKNDGAGKETDKMEHNLSPG